MLKNSLKPPAVKHKTEKKTLLVPRVNYSSDQPLLCSLMQNQRNSQMTLSLAPAE